MYTKDILKTNFSATGFEAALSAKRALVETPDSHRRASLCKSHLTAFVLVLASWSWNVCVAQALLAVQPSSWLAGCVQLTDPTALRCEVQEDLTFDPQLSGSVPALVDVPLLIEGGGGFPALNFSDSTGLFLTAPNATISFRRLSLVNVLLEANFPLSSASFLRLLAFSSGPAAPPAPGSPQRRLSLQDVTITTRSCNSLVPHQAFACDASPSPNFTVTPGVLVVHSYTSANIHAMNVTLRCRGARLPNPCWATTVGSGAELLAVLQAASNPDPVPGITDTSFLLSMPVKVLINRSFALREAWPLLPSSPPLGSQAPSNVPSQPDEQQQQQQQLTPLLVYARPLILSGGSMAALSNGTIPPIAIDLIGTADMMKLAANARIELRNLTLLNPPLGAPSNYHYTLLTLPLWTFWMKMMGYGAISDGMPLLLLSGCAVQLHPSELALWHWDVVGVVPPELRGSFCAFDNGILQTGSGETDTNDMMGTGSGEVFLWGIRISGGGLFVKALRSRIKGVQLFEQTLLFPSPFTEQGQQPLVPPAAVSSPPLPQLQNLGREEETNHDAGALSGEPVVGSGTVEITPTVPVNSATWPLCQLMAEGDMTPVGLHQVLRTFGQQNPKLLTVMVDGSNYSSQPLDFYAVFTDDAVLRTSASTPLMNGALVRDSFLYYQAQVSGKQVLLGDPLGPRLLHMSYAPATINVRAASATLTVRQLVLAGLPPAGLHPSSPAWRSLREGTAGEAPYGDGGWPPYVPGAVPQHWGRRRRRCLLDVRGQASDGGPPKPGRKGSPSGDVKASKSHAAQWRRRLAQLYNTGIRSNSTVFLGPAAGDNPTGGLTPGLANFTSCLWSLDFDRSAIMEPAVASPPPSEAPEQQHAPAGAGGYRVFLDSVVLLVPPGELALIVWAWAEHLAAAAVDAAGKSSGFGPSAGKGETVATAASKFDFVSATIEPPGTGTSALLQLLRALPQTSQLMMSRDGAAPTAAYLERLTVRLLAMEAARRKQMADEALEAEGSDGGDSHWWKPQADELGDNSTFASTAGPAPIASLTFSVFSWCGLRGRNVSLSAEPLLGPGSVVTSDLQLWSRRLVDIPLGLALRQQTNMTAEATSLTPEDRAEPPSPSTTESLKQQAPIPLPVQIPSPVLSKEAGMAPTLPIPPEEKAPPPLQATAKYTTGGLAVVAGAVTAGCLMVCLIVGLVAGVLLLRRSRRQGHVQLKSIRLMASSEQLSASASTPSAATLAGADMAAVVAAMSSLMCAANQFRDEKVVATDGVALGRPEVSLQSTEQGARGGLSNPVSLEPICSGDQYRIHPTAGARCPDGSEATESGSITADQVKRGGEGGSELVLMGELGRGAQGVVYRGMWRGLEVAVKSVLFQPGAAAAHHRHHSPVHEAAIAVSVTHPNVVTTYTHQLQCLDRTGPVQPLQMLQPSGHQESMSFPWRQPPQSQPQPQNMPTQEQRGAEPEVWRLTLIQELCSAGSLRQCLDSGLLAGCGMGLGADSSAGMGDSGRRSLEWNAVTVPSGGPSATESTLVSQPASTPPGDPMSLAAPTRGSRLVVSLAVALQVARGMEYLHSRGILHGDLSSANVLLQTCPKPQPPPAAQAVRGPMISGADARFRSLRVGGADYVGMGSAAAAVTAATAAATASAAPGAGQGLPPRPRHTVDGVINTAAVVSPNLQPRGSLNINSHLYDRASGLVVINHPAMNPRTSRAGWLSCCGRDYGYGYVAKVADFGLSGRLQGDETHLSGESRRSWLYSAPELVQYGTCTKGTDVYAFAVILYEVVVGRSLPVLLREPQLGAGLRTWMAEVQQHLSVVLYPSEVPATPEVQDGELQDQQQCTYGNRELPAGAALPPSLLVWPDQAPPGIAALVSDCLAADPAARPSFTSVCTRLQQLLEPFLPAPPPRPAPSSILASGRRSEDLQPGMPWPRSGFEWRRHTGKGTGAFKLREYLEELNDA